MIDQQVQDDAACELIMAAVEGPSEKTVLELAVELKGRLEGFDGPPHL